MYHYIQFHKNKVKTIFTAKMFKKNNNNNNNNFFCYFNAFKNAIVKCSTNCFGFAFTNSTPIHSV